MSGILGKRCSAVIDNEIKEGTIKGCYYNEYWHPYTYRAFHIEFDDGTKDTLRAKDVDVTFKLN
ncbi:hypothetical protein [Oceanobacillus luteolus]|uniref:Uncharacterized protein n=1 Tax=Oceanobacillus luteolus TaxID=1274358 RepID=A0ABW4HVX6_9BACI